MAADCPVCPEVVDEVDACNASGELYDVPLHIAAVFIILFASALGVASTLAGKACPLLRISPYATALGKAAGTGIILATALIHMLQPANESLTSPCVPTAFNTDYAAYAYLYALLAGLAMQVVEYSVSRCVRNAVGRAVASAGGSGVGGGDIRGGGGGGSSSVDSGTATRRRLSLRSSAAAAASSAAAASAAALAAKATICAEPDCPAESTLASVAACREVGCSGGADDEDEGAGILHTLSAVVDVRQGGGSVLSSPAVGVGGAITLDDDDDAAATAASRHAHAHAHEHGHSHGHHGHAHGHGLPSALISAMAHDGGVSLISAVLMEFGFTLHSIFIGLALGVATGTDLVALLIALSFHQFFEGVALGARLTDSKLPSALDFTFSAIFTVSAPIGIAVGVGVMTGSGVMNTNGESFLLVQGTFDAICAGILLYIGFACLLIDFPKDLERVVGGAQHKSSDVRRLGMFVALWGGAGLMAFIGRYL